MRSQKKLFAGEIHDNNAKHCCYIATKFNINHSTCNLIKHKKVINKNKMLNLNIDDDFDFLKEMYCMFKGIHLSDVVETRSLYVKIMKELVPDDSSELIICQHMKKAIKIKLQRTSNKNIEINTNSHVSIPTIVQEDDDEVMSLKGSDKKEKGTKRRKERALKPYIQVSNRKKKERVKDIKNFVVKCANPTAPIDSSEYRSQCEHVLEDVVQALRDSKMISNNAHIDNNTVDHSLIESNDKFEEINDELSRYFDLELSNQKYHKAQKLLLERSGVKLLPRSQLRKSNTRSSFIGFKVKWMEKKTNQNGSTYEEEEENFGARLDFIDSIKSYVDRDRSKFGIMYNNNDEIVCIVNSCDGAIHPVTKFCDRTILTQSIGILTPTSVKYHNRNLATPGNLMTLMSTNGKEDTKTLDNVFEHYFSKKEKLVDIKGAMERENHDKLLLLELHDVKFTYTIFNRNWNREFFPFLGCYCQRGDSFREGHTCRRMTDEEHLACYENASMEWEEIKKIEDNPSFSEHADWCSEFNFGVNNFGMHPKHVPLSTIRYDVGLHMVCAIIRKILHVLRQHLDRYSDNNVIFKYFDTIWENTFYSNQFRYCEVCSRIDGSHVSKFIKNINELVTIINNEYENSTYLNHMCQVLALVPKLSEFWKKVKVNSHESHMEEIQDYEMKMNTFYYHGSFCIFTNTVKGDGETFYCHIAKHWIPNMARWTLDNLGCGVGIWTMQGFEHRNKQSKFVYAHKTNGKGNCCLQVLKGLHNSFLHN